MKSLKAIAGVICGMFAISSLFAQEKKSETSVESEYLSSIQDVVITELANSDERDNKLVALQYLETAVNEGNVTPDMIKAIDQLAGEGISSESRTNGRLTNNYPDIRRRSVELLANVKTEESKEILLKVTKNDNEPTVLAAAIRSLGEVGINNKDEVVDTIAWANKRNAVLNPTSSMALEVLIAYEKLMDTVENKGPLIQSVGQIATNYRYVKPVRDRALEMLKKLNASNGTKKSSSASEGK